MTDTHTHTHYTENIPIGRAQKNRSPAAAGRRRVSLKKATTTCTQRTGAHLGGIVTKMNINIVWEKTDARFCYARLYREESFSTTDERVKPPLPGRHIIIVFILSSVDLIDIIILDNIIISGTNRLCF